MERDEGMNLGSPFSDFLRSVEHLWLIWETTPLNILNTSKHLSGTGWLGTTQVGLVWVGSGVPTPRIAQTPRPNRTGTCVVRFS